MHSSCSSIHAPPATRMEAAATQSPPSSSVSSESSASMNRCSVMADHDLPADIVDDRHLARQRRKRTSPEDAATLEAAYQQDPKPDKAARRDLVSRVALDEKGVQIWFQNRRQTSRRRSRPLLPHEVAQYHISRADSAPWSFPSGFDSASKDDSGIDLSCVRPQSSHSRSGDCSVDAKSNSASPCPIELQMSADAAIGTDDMAVPSSMHFENPTTEQYNSVTSNSAITIGYLSNRRSASSQQCSLANRATFTTPAMAIDASRSLKRSSSMVRLSMNGEGRAEIVTKDVSSPSPPRPQQVFQPELLAAVCPSRIASGTRSLQRSSSGRSRDSRSWEFWCDKEARSQLGNAAEKASTGSAAGAIGLLRSASGRSVLRAVPSKRNSIFTRERSSAKRMKPSSKTASWQSSDTSRHNLADQRQHTKWSKHGSAAHGSFRSKGNDSDKENLSPDPEPLSGTQTSPTENDSDLSQQQLATNQNDDHDYSQPSRSDINGNPGPATAKSGSAASGADLDCVQGLLSLSQGNWNT